MSHLQTLERGLFSVDANNTSTEPPLFLTALIDSFKDSFSSKMAASAVIEIFSQSKPTLSTINPMALAISDGGEGFVEAMSAATQLEPQSHVITGPLQQDIEVNYLFDPSQQLAILESAQGVGIQAVPLSRRDPRVVSSHGVGQQLRKVLLAHPSITTIIMGLGGTASVDCGLGLLFGLLEIMCYRKLPSCSSHNDGEGTNVPTNGGFDVCLDQIVDIILPVPPQFYSTTSHYQEQANVENWSILCLLMKATIILASDVTNQLLGSRGSTVVFGPQKGLQADQLETWESGMASFSHLLAEICHAPPHIVNIAGCGAAGGLPFALYCLVYYHFYWQQRLAALESATCLPDIRENAILMRSGFELLCDYTPTLSFIREHITLSPLARSIIPSSNQLIITGEGRFDFQSLGGKVIDRVCKIVSQVQIDSKSPVTNIPVIILCGSNGFGITNPKLVNFVDSDSIDSGNVDEENNNSDDGTIASTLGKMNIIKIIDINDERYHLEDQRQNRESVLNHTLEDKLKDGLMNFHRTLAFLFDLWTRTSSPLDQRNSHSTHLLRFIHALRDIE